MPRTFRLPFGMLRLLTSLLAGLASFLSCETTLAAEPAAANRTRILLIGQGPDGHPVSTHEYRAGTTLLAKLLSRHPQIQTIVVSADGEWADGPTLLENADAAVLFVSEGAKWIQARPERLAAFQALAKRKGGLVCLHWCMGAKDAENIPRFVELFGGCHGGPDRRYKVISLKPELDNTTHPILRGVTPVEVHEEFYFKLKLPASLDKHVPLVKVNIDGESYPVAWAWERPDGGRSFGFSGFHFHDNWKHESYRRLATQAVLWSCNRDIPAAGADVSVTDADFGLPAKPPGE